MLRKIAASLGANSATLWLVNTTYLWAVPLCSLGGLPILKVMPWWLFVTLIAAGSVFVTRIRLMRGEPNIARVTVLWLGLVPVKRSRQGCKVIAAERSWDNDGELPDEVTLNFLGDEPWSFGAFKARETAAWLCRARSALWGEAGASSVDSTESISKDDAAPQQ